MTKDQAVEPDREQKPKTARDAALVNIDRLRRLLRGAK